MPSASYSHSAKTTSSSGQVWRRLQEPEVWATVAGVDSTSDHEFDGPELTRFRFTTSIGGVGYRGRAYVAAASPEKSMSLRIESRELTGIIDVELAGAADGTLIDVRMSMRPAGLMGTVVFPVVTAAVASGFDESVERLADRLSDG